MWCLWVLAVNDGVARSLKCDVYKNSLNSNQQHQSHERCFKCSNRKHSLPKTETRLVRTLCTPANQPPPPHPSLNLWIRIGWFWMILSNMVIVMTTVEECMWPWRKSNSQSSPNVLCSSSQNLGVVLIRRRIASFLS